MNTEPPIWLTEAEVVSLLDLGEAVTAVRSGYALQARGELANLVKGQRKLGGTTLHATGAVQSGSGYSGAKVWAHTAAGATPLMQVWDSETGRLIAVIEAFALGQYRTAAVSGLATDLLAVPGASELAMLGTGHQALAQVAAVKAVRQIKRVRVWSPRKESRQRMREEIENALALEVTVADSPEAAVEGAHVITTATRAAEPFLKAEFLTAGVHINAVGAIGLERMELTHEVFEQAAVIVVDDIPSAQQFSAELRDFCTKDDDWLRITPLASVVAADGARSSDADITVLKAMGAGIGDLAIAQFAIEQAWENRIGMPLPTPARSRPRLRSSLRRPAATPA
jgi:alanine dehydrogenase